MTFGTAGLQQHELDGMAVLVTRYQGFDRPAFTQRATLLGDGSVARNTVLQSGSTPSRTASVEGIVILGDDGLDDGTIAAIEALADSLEIVSYTDLFSTRDVVVTSFKKGGAAEGPRTVGWTMELLEAGDPIEAS